MNKTIVFFVSLILIAMCSSSKAVSYDGILDKLVELNQIAGKDKNDIGLLISQVSSATKESNDKFDKFITELVDRCNSGNSLQDAYLLKLAADKLMIQTTANQAADDNKALDTDKAKKGNELGLAKTDMQALKEQIKKTFEEYQVYGVEAEQKLTTIKFLKDIITDELLAPQKSASFVQLHTFNDKVRELKALLENSKEKAYSPLVSTLLSLAESKGFADKNMLNQILAALSKLQQSLENFRKKQNADVEKNIKSLKDQAKEKLTQIKSIARMISENERTSRDNDNIIASAARDVVSIDKQVSRKTDESQYWKKICQYQDGVKKTEQTFRDAFAGKVKDVNSKLVDLQ